MISTDGNLNAKAFGNEDRYFPTLKHWATKTAMKQQQ